MAIVSTKLLCLLGLCWMSKVGVTLRQSRECNTSYEDPGWQCNTGQCLKKVLICDGYFHCSDGSDESPATCCSSTCPSDRDICIPAGQEIKPGQHCRDCTRYNGDPGWRCNSGPCLRKRRVCDGGSPQCPDGEDESIGCFSCELEPRTINEPNITINTEVEKVPILKVCNNIIDCVDRKVFGGSGRDESDQLCNEHFQCLNNSTIKVPNAFVCNSNPDLSLIHI